MLNPPEGCPFAPRCEHAMKICLQKMPPYVEMWEKIIMRHAGRGVQD
ncbi:MAG: hypothetical protein ACLTDV_06335 [Eubacterium sp.]